MLIQAETAVLNGAEIANDHENADGGSFVDFIEDSGSFLEWDVDADLAGPFDLDIRYALGIAESRSMAIEVNGTRLADPITFTTTGDWSAWEFVQQTINLQAGQNNIRLVSIGESGPNIDSLTAGSQPAPDAGDDAVTDRVIIQAEDTTLVGAVVVDGVPEADGGAFVDFTAPAGQSLEFTVNADRDGTETLTFNYALFGGQRDMLLEINGVVVNDAFSFEATGGARTFADESIRVDLVAGENTIRLIANGDSGPDFDSISIGDAPGTQPELGDISDSLNFLTPNETNVPTDASFAVGVIVRAPEDAIDLNTVNADTVRLINTDTGARVEGSANTTGGRDSISFTPDEQLDPNTNYSLVLDGVQSDAGEEYTSIARTFTTGNGPAVGGTPGDTAGDIHFDRSVVDGGDPYASIAVSQDETMLYATTLDGQIIRWTIDADGGLSNKQSISISTADDPRTLIGLEWDPDVPGRLWFSNNATVFQEGQDRFSGNISYIDIDDGAAFTGEVTDYATGLPRSSRDHMVNSIEAGPDGALYVNVGGLSAMSAPDAAWAFREETLLSASVLRVDPTATPPAGGFDLRTEDGGTYDPFAAGAPVTLYATGNRNSYDLVWHSNGSLYVPNNGSAAGGNSPDDPNTPQDESITNGETQQDYLYRIVEGGYYGHPNPTRGEHIRDGGEPHVGRRCRGSR